MVKSIEEQLAHGLLFLIVDSQSSCAQGGDQGRGLPRQKLKWAQKQGKEMFDLPNGLILDRGDSIHTSTDPRPHLTGLMEGHHVHLPWHGQTTLGMFDRDLGGHRLHEVESLVDRFPTVFRESGF